MMGKEDNKTIASESLASAYLKIKRSYASSSKKQESESLRDQSNTTTKQECSLDEELKLATPSGRKPPPIPANAVHICRDLEERFIQQVKISGLRATREKALIQTFTEVIASYKDTIGSLSSSIKNWVSYAEDVDESSSAVIRELEMELEGAIDETKSAEDEFEQTKWLHSQLQGDVEKLRSELEASQRDKDDLIKRNEMEMNAFLDKMEVQVDIARDQMAQETIQIKSDLRAKLEQEHMERMMKAEKQMCMLGAKKEQYINDLIAQQHEHDGVVKCFKIDVKAKDKSIIHLNDSIKQMKHQLQIHQEETSSIADRSKADMKRLKDDFDAFKHYREKELMDVERRVGQIINGKDKKLEAALERADEAEQRARAFERCITKLENGFIELPPQK